MSAQDWDFLTYLTHGYLLLLIGLAILVCLAPAPVVRIAKWVLLGAIVIGAVLVYTYPQWIAAFGRPVPCIVPLY